MPSTDPPPAPLLLHLWRLTAGVLAAVTLVRVGSAIVDPAVRDLTADLLSGHALRVGLDPYAPLDALFRALHPAESGGGYLPHPSPHPPPNLLWAAPMSWLPLPLAGLAWALIELGGLTMTLRAYRPGAHRTDLALFAATALAWAPVAGDLTFGQAGLLIGAALAVAYRLQSQGNEIGAGVCVGAALALKPLAWPVALWWLFAGRFRALAAAIAVFLALNIATWPMIGPARWWAFYVQIGPAVERIYRGYELNISSSAVAWRLLAGTGSVRVGIHAAPLLDLPSLAAPAAAAAALMTGVIAATLATRRSDLRQGWAIAITLSTIASPVAWGHYFGLLVGPILLLTDGMDLRTDRRVLGLLATVLLCSLSDAVLHPLITWGSAGGDHPEVSAGMAMISLLPGLGPWALAATLLSRPPPDR